jgi:hypothetical protein
VAADGLEGLEAVEGAVGPVAEALEDQEDELLVGGVVLDGEDAQREALAHGGVELAACGSGSRDSGGRRPTSSCRRVSYSCEALIGLVTTVARWRWGSCVAAAERGEEDGRGGVAVQLLQDAEVAVLGQQAVDEADVDVAAAAEVVEGVGRGAEEDRDHAPGAHVGGEELALGVAGVDDEELRPNRGVALNSGSLAALSAAARIVK